MTISQTAEYALRAVVWLARHTDAPLGTAEVARYTRVPAGYLSKVLQELSRAGLVVSTPGRNGGFQLARPAAGMSVLDVINAVDPITRIERCPLGLVHSGGELCPLHSRLDRAIEMVQHAFADSTIAELVAESAGDEPLCKGPADAPATKGLQKPETAEAGSRGTPAVPRKSGK